MAWTNPSIRATGDVITSAIWNGDIINNLLFLSTHTHSGVDGQGSGSLGPLVLADFTTAAAPAAPGASKGRFYTVTGDRPGFRSGAAGSAEVLVTRDVAETLTNKTLTAPTIADFTNAQHDHADADDGGVAAGVPLRAITTVDVTKNANTTLGNITGLAVALEANKTYIFKALIKYSTELAADIKFAFTVPAAAAIIWQSVENSALASLGEREEGASGGNINFLGGGSNNLALAEGIVINGANAGDLQGQFAQNTSDASDTIVQIGSSLIAWKMN